VGLSGNLWWCAQLQRCSFVLSELIYTRLHLRYTAVIWYYGILPEFHTKKWGYERFMMCNDYDLYGTMAFLVFRPDLPRNGAASHLEGPMDHLVCSVHQHE
jgi:hypothetical protein